MKRRAATKSTPRTSRATAPAGDNTLVRGRLRALGEEGGAWVTWGTATKPRPVAATLDLDPAHVGREVLLAFPDGRDADPVLVGVLRARGERLAPAAPLDLTVDRERIVLSARTEIVLRVGKATISLNADGQVTIKGANVVSTAAGTNRIRGGNVQIN